MNRIVDVLATKKTWLRLIAVGSLFIAAGAMASILLIKHSRTEPTTSDAWLAKVHDVKGQFPPGYEVALTQTLVITQDYLDEMKAPMQGATFIPAECADQVNSEAALPVGATTEGLQGTLNDRLITVAAMQTLAPLGPHPVTSQCAAVAFVQPGYIHGFTSRVGAPEIPDVRDVQGIRMSGTITDPSGQDTDIVQYAYIATLDDRHVVSVTIRGTPLLGQPNDIDPTPAQHLLTEAVRALRR